MAVEQQNPTIEATSGKTSHGFHRSHLVVPLFIFAGFAATYVTLMTMVAVAYDLKGHARTNVVSHYGPELLFLPCFLLAMVPRRWMSVPLWLCSLLLLVMGLIDSHEPANSGAFQAGIGVLVIPALAQLARFFRGKQSESNG
jgi:hypothetical protein